MKVVPLRKNGRKHGGVPIPLNWHCIWTENATINTFSFLVLISAEKCDRLMVSTLVSNIKALDSIPGSIS